MTDTINLTEQAESLTASQLVDAVVEASGGRDLCFTSSFQTEDMVVLDLVRRRAPDVPVIFLETGYHFAELIAYRDSIVKEWSLNLVNALPKTTLAEHESQFGLLHIIDPGQCCAIRKVEPLMRSLEPFAWWFTGLRREQSPTRANLKKVEDHKLPSGKLMKKVSVLADWTWADVEAYATEHAIPPAGAVRARVHVHRLRAVHEDPRGRRRSAQWPLGRQEAGMRHPYLQREGVNWRQPRGACRLAQEDNCCHAGAPQHYRALETRTGRGSGHAGARGWLELSQARSSAADRSER